MLETISLSEQINYLTIYFQIHYDLLIEYSMDKETDSHHHTQIYKLKKSYVKS